MQSFFDKERNFWGVGLSTVAGVEKAYALLDLTEVAAVEPFLAFKAFDAFASGALASRYVDDLKTAMLNEAATEAFAVMEATGTKPKGRRKPPKTSKADEPGKVHEIHIEMGPYADRLAAIPALRIERDIARRLSERIAPLLPAIRAYTDKRGTDPITANLLAGLINKIQNGHKYAAQPKSEGVPGSPSELIHAYMNLWRGLYTGLLDIAGRYGTTAPAQSATPTAAPAERLKWKSSTAAFAYIFRTLAAQGYFDLPRKGGKGNDPNTAAFARMLLQAFEIPGKDGNPITPEVLRVRLADGAPGRLADTKAAKFQIPAAGELIVPDAGEME